MARVWKLFRPKNLLIGLTIFCMLLLLLSYTSPYLHPETAGLIPFFGLSYIITISLCLGLILIWSILKSKWALAVLFVVLIGGKLHFRVFAIGGDDSRSPRTEFKVMSYNVRLFDRYNPSREESLVTRNKIFDHLNKEQPDIICFQEFYHQDPPTKFSTKDTIRKILRSKGIHERYMHKARGRQNFGIALFSKYPIIKQGDVIFSESEESFNYCIYADIVKNKDTVRVYNVHLQSIRLQKDDYGLFNIVDGSNEESTKYISVFRKIKSAYPTRARQSKKVTDHISKSPYPVIVCGDFNDTPLSYSYNMFNRQLSDAFRMSSFGIGKTYAGNIPAGRIDYIFHSPELGAKDFEIQQESLSDHYAIRATIFTSDEP